MKKCIISSDREIIQKSFLPEVDFGKEYWTSGELYEGYDYCFSEKRIIDNEGEGSLHSFSYINNPDGSIRWIFSSDATFPGFLDLYNSSGLKARLLALFCRFLFLMKLQFLIVSGRFYLFARKSYLQQKWKAHLDFDTFSVFTGTVGPNRKVLFALHKKRKTIGFVKHPISYESLRLVSTENTVLKVMEENTFSNMLLPQSTYLGNGDMYTNNIRDFKVSSVYAFTHLHALALKDLYVFKPEVLCLKDSVFFTDLKKMLAGIDYNSHVPHHRELFDLLQSLFESIDCEQKISAAWAHMDFTPWNLFVPADESKLAVIDWELSKPGIPMLFDLFHFVFQSQILLERQNYKAIHQRIEQIITQNHTVKQMIERHQIDLKLHFRLYLLFNISYYLNIYQKQPKLHVQVNWLTAVWKDALATEIKLEESKSYREVFIADLFCFMRGKQYAWLHSRHAKMTGIAPSSDLDFVLTQSAKQEVLSFCKSHVLTARLKYFQKSFMTTVELFFSDGSFLSLDLITRLVRKNLVFMSAAQMIDRASCNSEGIMLPSNKDDLNYLILFTSLNNSIMPDKYQKFYAGMSELEQDEIRQFVYSKYGIYGENLKQMFQHLYENASQIKRAISHQNRNKGFGFVINSYRYVSDTVCSLLFRKGLVITFSGVDGAGKSTLIADVAHRLERDYRKKVVILRHRPSLFPILSAFRYGRKEAERRAGNTLPHQGKNKGVLSSILRFSYYYIDYLLGQFYVYMRFVSRDCVVLYDRYYFDFINDSKRSNILIPKKIVRLLYALIYKPKYNFFFYASPEIIRERKKELSASEISRMTQNYFSTFKRFEEKYAHSQYHCIENVDREETLSKVFQQVQQSL